MLEIKAKVVPEDTDDDFQPQIIHKHLEVIQETLDVKSTIDNRLKHVKRPESQASIKPKRQESLESGKQAIKSFHGSAYEEYLGGAPISINIASHQLVF